MEKFIRHLGIAAPLLRVNVDTDAIIPSREMKRVSKQGLGEGLFAGWRYLQAGSREPDPDFVLNQKAYQNASILLAGANFGCGSSREHAVWALKEFGIRVVIAPSFGAIFRNNCICNGILPLSLNDAAIQQLADAVTADPQGRPLLIDLETKTISTPCDDGSTLQLYFDIDAASRDILMQGLDPIGVTLTQLPAIEAFEQRDRELRPWIALA